MKPRKRAYGDKNICGANIERIRKKQGMKQVTLATRMQLMGVDIGSIEPVKIGRTDQSSH